MNQNFLELISDYLDGRNQMDQFLEGIQIFNSKLVQFNSLNLEDQKNLLIELKTIGAILNQISIGDENRYLLSKKEQINNLLGDLENSLNVI